ncbi:helix-turn-helix transcriptional regulator [Streptomyces subrutilus]|uniref:helix-turn-helix transcriptional regulator n=1 Tax=Streptomyces subrutilus TaxID=36818 RepID=UPI002E15CFD3|nr:helix-turn-helix domain-containing protein [Streptomyces subrutilus]
MNRDPHAWARLGRALKQARLAQGMDQAELAEKADVSRMSVQSAEAGTMPKSRMPYTLPAIASTLGWPPGSVEAILDGAEPPAAWRDVPVQAALNAERLETILSAAMVRATDNVTPAEIRAATKIALDELRREGMLAETDGVQP